MTRQTICLSDNHVIKQPIHQTIDPSDNHVIKQSNEQSPPCSSYPLSIIKSGHRSIDPSDIQALGQANQQTKTPLNNRAIKSSDYRARKLSTYRTSTSSIKPSGKQSLSEGCRFIAGQALFFPDLISQTLYQLQCLNSGMAVIYLLFFRK